MIGQQGCGRPARRGGNFFGACGGEVKRVVQRQTRWGQAAGGLVAGVPPHGVWKGPSVRLLEGSTSGGMLGEGFDP